jgi:hypothetical protein
VRFTTPDAGAPDSPSVMEFVSTSPTSLTVQWDTPNDQGSAITGFELAMDNGWFGTPIQSVLNTSGTNSTVQDKLVPASAYNFEVRAYNKVALPVYDRSNWILWKHWRRGNLFQAEELNSAHNSKILLQVHCIWREFAINDIVATTGLSHDCATCWGNLGECTISNCLIQCVDPRSQSC